MVRRAFGILFLAGAMITMGPAVFVLGLDLDDEPGRSGTTNPNRLEPLILPLIFLVPGSVFTVVGMLLVGVRFWRISVGWTLVATALYGLFAFLTMFAVLSTDSLDALGPAERSSLEQVTLRPVPPFALALVLLLIGSSLALRGTNVVGILRGTTSLSGAPWTPGARPLSVAIIAWLLIVTGGLGLPSQLLMLMIPGWRESAASYSSMPFALQWTLGVGGGFVALLCGIYMLKGSDRARWAYMAASLLLVAITLATSKSYALLLPGLVFYPVIVFFLFRKPANDFFADRGDPGTRVDASLRTPRPDC